MGEMGVIWAGVKHRFRGFYTRLHIMYYIHANINRALSPQRYLDGAWPLEWDYCIGHSTIVHSTTPARHLENAE